MKNNRIAVCADLMMQREYGLCLKLWLSLSTIHTLVIGPSGSGKSIFLKFFLYNLLHTQKVEVHFLDFKNSDDFKFLEAYSNYSTGDGCIDGLAKFYEEFKQARINHEMCKDTRHIMIFDELPAYLIYLSGKDKKLAESHKAMISEILMLGRSLGFGFICAMQRPDAQFFGNGARDNFFNIVALGNLSKEAKNMVFAGYELPDNHYKTGQGLILCAGKDVEEFCMPYFDNKKIQRMEQNIRERLKLD